MLVTIWRHLMVHRISHWGAHWLIHRLGHRWPHRGLWTRIPWAVVGSWCWFRLKTKRQQIALCNHLSHCFNMKEFKELKQSDQERTQTFSRAKKITQSSPLHDYASTSRDVNSVTKEYTEYSSYIQKIF